MNAHLPQNGTARKVNTAIGRIPNPIRIDLWSSSDLRAFGRGLHGSDEVALPEYEQTSSFAARIRENERAIRENYIATAETVRKRIAITPAAEWLLDNHHIVEENIRHIRRDLKPGFYGILPTWKVPGKGSVPRILALCWLYVAHTNSDFSNESLTAFMEGFQEHQELTIGELWAAPAFLRYVLIENLRRLSDRVRNAREMRSEANRLADQLMAEEDADRRIELMARKAALTHDNTFAAQLLYRFRDGSQWATQALQWLEEALEARTSHGEAVVVAEQNRQSSGNLTTGNIITSLRRIDDVYWQGWFEALSAVDRTLRAGSDFALLDASTRNTYRDAIEMFARRSNLSETQVAQAAIDLAASHRDLDIASDPKADVGYYLVGPGRQDLREATSSRPRFGSGVLRWYRSLGWLGAALPNFLMTAVFLLLGGWYLWSHSISPAATLPLLILFALPASEAAAAFVQTMSGLLLKPYHMPGYELKDGVPDHARTLVAIPCLITNHDTVDELVRNLELHYLANPQGAVSFALLSDWRDSPQEETQADRDILAYAQQEIDRLAQSYSHAGRRFFLLHRRRLFNPGEGVWMGWERKRGKLHELNLLLRGDRDTTYFTPANPLPADIKYVLTLDSDTRLPLFSVASLVGKMIHPLNKPVFDEKQQRVVSGYTILQPRVTPSLTTGAEASAFQRTFSANRGFDPYVFTVSDFYQDLVGEGSFTGKGLYDVDAFEATMKGRIDENSVLSHDLLEGSLARCALVTDVEFVEDFPVRYQVEVSRQHRWARGDWQLLPYILGFRKGVTGIGRLKMIDNLRRSLLPIGWVASSILAWSALPLAEAEFWQLVLIVTLTVAPLLSFLRQIVPSRIGVTLGGHLRTLGSSLLEMLAEIALRIIFMAHTAYVMADAILRTLWRLLVSRRHLLEWRTAQQVSSAGQLSVFGYYRMMWASIAIGLAGVAFILLAKPQNLPLAIAFGLLWAAAPAIAWAVSRTAETEDLLELSRSESRQLRIIARKTWRYFETFVIPELNYLPPDNFQEDPEPVVAERTSPTNVGLYLLSTLTARDFGWITLDDAVDRIEKTITTVERMKKYRGHLYNWYDIRSLEVLPPGYISAVDSGNLAGHLVAVSSALRKWAESPAAQRLPDGEGVADVAEIVRETLSKVPDDRRNLRPVRQRISELLDGLVGLLDNENAERRLAPFKSGDIPAAAREIGELAASLAEDPKSSETVELAYWASILERTCIAVASEHSGNGSGDRVLADRLRVLAERARAIAFAMDFRFLMDEQRRLLSIGYRTDAKELDRSCYDLLASEARLTSLFAIAKGDLPKEHWFRLGRPVTSVRWQAALVSWSGSMFEYLMPPLVMYEREGGILNQSNRLAIARQIEYARPFGIPWGISESAFNTRDRAMNYQYQNFGVPSLGLKHDLSSNLVIAPYATALATQYRPHEAIANFRRLAELGAMGVHGYYDAVDFTPSRVPEGQKQAVVRNYLAHHQGMSIAAIGNAVLNGRLREHFHSDPVIEAAELLLQERAPREVVPVTRAGQLEDRPAGYNDTGGLQFVRVDDPLTAKRATSVLSNGRYNVMLTATGSGYSRWNDQAITRWRPDPTADRWGTYIFLRDEQTGDWWSATAEPKQAPGEKAFAIFADHRAEFHKTAHGIETRLECLVCSGSDGEGRRLTIINRTDRDRFIEVTSYGECVLSRDEADIAHPLFSKMFIRTEIGEQGDVIYASRNKRTPSDPDIIIGHLVADHAQGGRETQAETDRRAFIGRGRDITEPAAFDPGARHSGSAGFTMDPVFSLRRTLRIPAGKETSITFWTIAAPDREGLDRAISHYRRAETFAHETTLAWTRSQVQIRHIDMTAEEAANFQKLATFLIYPDLGLRPKEAVTRQGLRPQSSLWPMSISGDYPIFSLRIDGEAELGTVREALRMQEYLRSRGVISDLVIVNERSVSYAQDLNNAIASLCDNARRRGSSSGPGQHIFSVRRDLMGEESWTALLAASRIALHTRNGKLSEQLARLERSEEEAGIKTPLTRFALPDLRHATDQAPIDGSDLDNWNGYGGFARDSRAYVVRLRAGQSTPHPWINVISGKDFGFHVSAEGAAYTWGANSRDYQLSPWSNDTVVNQPCEGMYVRDLESDAVLSPLSCLSTDPAAIFEARHQPGRSSFSTVSGGLELELSQTVARGDPVKVSRLKLRNAGTSARRLRIFSYSELVLGNNKARSGSFVTAQFDETLDMLCATNHYSLDYSGRTAFMGASEPLTSFTASRDEFLGRNGSMRMPDALRGDATLSRSADPSGDPCLAIACDLTLAPGEEREILLYLGDTPDAELEGVVERCRGIDFEKLSAETDLDWSRFLDTLQVETPDSAMDRMVNTWLPYQNLGCRIRARAAFYQASGAFGFRDQLQDTAALLLHDSSLARAQIINAASRQFVEGDVQHWWLPATGAGVRTIISDDVVWLAHLTAHYVTVTGDHAILDEQVPFLQGPPLEPGKHDSFYRPEVSGETASLYEHCVRALALAIERTGPHGIPLILGGDWNDGMNRVGEHGTGESIWLGWFLASTLESFSPIAESRGDAANARKWLAHRQSVISAIEKHAWDGDHYLRGYYDDGTPLGANSAAECRIDSIAQTWSVISGAADPARAEIAMNAVLERLRDEEAGILKLFTPPFEKTDKDPGYIKGYPPGVRENGGQYTHAATWVVYALARMGRGDDAYSCFSLLNPVGHSRTPQEAERYRVEPYVVAADVYGEAEKAGRGGWTWYTGSAGWLFRAAVEGILGIRRNGDVLHVEPAIPAHWDGFGATLRQEGRTYDIKVTRRKDGSLQATVNGSESDRTDGGFRL
jgi:cyclic beta-1,2-glucan synthetase